VESHKLGRLARGSRGFSIRYLKKCKYGCSSEGRKAKKVGEKGGQLILRERNFGRKKPGGHAKEWGKD